MTERNPRLRFDRFLLTGFYIQAWSYSKILADELLMPFSNRQDGIHLFFVAMSHLLLKIYSTYGMVLPVPWFMEETIPELYRFIVPSNPLEDLSHYSSLKWGVRFDVKYEASQTKGWSNVPIILFIIGNFIYRKNHFIQLDNEKIKFQPGTIVDSPSDYLPRFRVGPSWWNDDKKLKMGLYELILFLLYDLSKPANTSELYTVIREGINFVLWQMPHKKMYSCIQDSFSDAWLSFMVFRNEKGNPYKDPLPPVLEKHQAASKSKPEHLKQISQKHKAACDSKQDQAPHAQEQVSAIQDKEQKPISEGGIPMTEPKKDQVTHNTSSIQQVRCEELDWEDEDILVEEASKLLTEPDETDMPRTEGDNNIQNNIAPGNASEENIESEEIDKSDDNTDKTETHQKKRQRELLHKDRGRSRRAITKVTPYSTGQVGTDHDASREKQRKKPRASSVEQEQVETEKLPNVRKFHSLRPQFDTCDTPWYWQPQDTDQSRDFESVELSINEIKCRQEYNLYRLAYSWIMAGYAHQNDVGDGEALLDVLTRPLFATDAAALQWMKRLLLLQFRCKKIVSGSQHVLGELQVQNFTQGISLEQYFDGVMDTGYPLMKAMEGEGDIDPNQAQVSCCWTTMDFPDDLKCNKVWMAFCIHNWKSQVMFNKMILDYYHDNIRDTRMRTDAAFNIRENSKVYPRDLTSKRRKLVWEEVFHSVVFHTKRLELTPTSFDGDRRNMTFLDYLEFETDKKLQASFEPYEAITEIETDVGGGLA